MHYESWKPSTRDLEGEDFIDLGFSIVPIFFPDQGQKQKTRVGGGGGKEALVLLGRIIALRLIQLHPGSGLHHIPIFTTSLF